MNFKQRFMGEMYCHFSPKNPLVMKITACLLLFSVMTASATSTVAQHISIQARSTTLENVLTQLRKQSGYDLVFSDRLLKSAKPVTVYLKDSFLDEALNTIFEGQPLSYEIDGHTIVIKEKTSSVSNSIRSIFVSNTIVVKGRVVDASGKPIPGVTIRTADNKNATTSDGDGLFVLNSVNDGVNLIFSAIGFKSIEVKAKALMGNITLQPLVSKLDELMVIGYGTTTQRLTTGSQSKISGNVVAQQPETNPILSLEGTVPGLFITTQSGYAGSNLNVNIRGQNSLNSLTAQPLYVIDGVPFTGTPVERSTGGFVVSTPGFSPMNALNPDAIESITVLKDADATAIYGSRGAAGVILITTKKGRAGATNFSVNVESGVNTPTHLVKLLSTSQFLAQRRRAFADDGVTPTAANAPDLVTWSPDVDNNWGKMIIGQTSHQTNVGFNMSGGNAQTQFTFGGNIRSQSSVYYTKTKDEGQQFNLGVSHRSTDGKFGFDANINYNLDNNKIPSYALNYTNYSMAPNYPVKNPDGSLYWATGYTNPLATFNSNLTAKTNNLVANSVLRYTLLPGLDLKASLGYNKIDVTGTMIQPSSAFNPTSNSSQLAFLNENYIQTYIVEPQATYTHHWGKHGVSALVGGSWQETQTTQPYFILGTFTNIQLATSISGLTILSKQAGYTDYRYISGFSRLSYNFNEKYIFNVNFRRDGSSRFGPNNRFGNFGSVGAAWIFSDEAFAKNAMPWLSFGKLRGSWGSIGNDRIQDYLYEATYGSLGSSYGSVLGYAPTRIANADLKWEVTKKADIAIDFGFLNNRLLVSADAYRNRSTNLLATTSTPSQTGFTNYTANMPAVVQNKGLELEVTTVNIQRNGFRWSTAVNVTIPQNKLIKFPNIASSSYASQYELGKSLSYYPMYHFTGFKDSLATVQDKNGNGVIETGLYAYGKGDKGGNANQDPIVYGGITNTFTYKGFELSFLIQGTARKNARGGLGVGAQPGMPYNMPVSMLSIPVRPSATYGTPASNAWSNYLQSDAMWESAAYLRLRNLSLAYNFNALVLRRLKMKSLQLYARGQNLFTVTGYKGLDPETFDVLPPMRTVLLGLKTTF
jgi:TonB-linked SusC/RagA family outer membrane protein